MTFKRILLTGGSGLLGRILTPMLRQHAEVVHFGVEDPADGAEYIAGDLRDADEVMKACQHVDAVIHAGALHGKAWSTAGDTVGFDVNVTGTKNVLEAAVRNRIPRVVFTSSIWATGHQSPPAAYLPIDEDLPRFPRELYGLSKALGEEICAYAAANGDVSTIVLRPGGIRPPESFHPAAPEYLFGCVDVRDVAQAHILALSAPEEIIHDVFVITADSPLCQVSSAEYRRAPAEVLKRLVPALAPAIDAGDCHPDPDAEWYSIAKAEDLLGYSPQYSLQSEE